MISPSVGVAHNDNVGGGTAGACGHVPGSQHLRSVHEVRHQFRALDPAWLHIFPKLAMPMVLEAQEGDVLWSYVSNETDVHDRV